MTLSKAEINKINERHIRGVDKWNRMFVGLSSDLEKYEDDIIHIKVENTEKVEQSNFETAERIVKTWINFNDKLSQAKGWVVYLYRTNASTGFAIGAGDLKNENVIESIVKQMNVKGELQLVSIFSAILGKSMNSKQQGG